MKSLFLALVMIASIGAYAQKPTFPPARVVDIAEDGVAAVDALTRAKAKDLKGFLASGNTTNAVTRQNTSPSTTVWSFTRQHCNLIGGTCLGGSVLKVNLTQVRKGSQVTIDATSSLLGIRDLPPQK